MNCSSPVCEASCGCLSLFELLFGFDTAVEDGAITALAEDVLVERTLAALALDPQIAILFLVQLQLLLPLDVDLFDAAITIGAHNFLTLFQQILAAKTCALHLREFEEAHVRVGHGRLEDVARMFSREQLHFATSTHNRLENAN